MRWVTPTYLAIREILKNAFYAGAYVRGKTRTERYVDEQGNVRQRKRKLPQSEWEVLIRGHHDGYIDWETYEENQRKIRGNVRRHIHHTGGAAREGSALLQGLGRCGHCGRGLRVIYHGDGRVPHYFCANDQVVAGRGVHCLYVSARHIHEPVVSAFLEAVRPAGVEAALQAADLVEQGRDAALGQWRLQVERAEYEASKAERRYRSVEPENRLVARGLEAEWEQRLQELQVTREELQRRELHRNRVLTEEERRQLLRLGEDISSVWSAATTTDRDRKQLLRALLEEVLVSIPNPGSSAHITLRWHGGLLTDLDVVLARRRAHTRTDEDTVSLIRRLAEYYPDATIAGILNRQGRKTAKGLCFTPPRIIALRQHWKIPCYQPPTEPPKGELVGITAVSEFLGLMGRTRQQSEILA